MIPEEISRMVDKVIALDGMKMTNVIHQILTQEKNPLSIRKSINSWEILQTAYSIQKFIYHSSKYPIRLAFVL